MDVQDRCCRSTGSCRPGFAAGIGIREIRFRVFLFFFGFFGFFGFCFVPGNEESFRRRSELFSMGNVSVGG